MKRPQIRPSRNCPTTKDSLDNHPILKKIIYPPEQEKQVIIRPVYNHADYIRLLNKNYEECNIDMDRFKKFEDSLPHVVPVGPRVSEKRKPFEFFEDHPALVKIYEKYYKKYKNPPLAAKVRCFKELGYSDKFLEKLIERHDRTVELCVKMGGMIDKVFKEPVKVTREKKRVEEEIEEKEIEEDEEEDEDIQPEIVVPEVVGDFDSDIEEEDVDLDEVEF